MKQTEKKQLERILNTIRNNKELFTLLNNDWDGIELLHQIFILEEMSM